jgi:AraC-like DNA-binding protein
VQHEQRIDAPPAGASVPQLLAGSSERISLKVACGLVRVWYGESLGLFDHLHDVLAVDLSDAPHVRASFQGILAEQTLPGPGSEAMKKALMSQCLVQALRHLCGMGDCSLPWLAALENVRLAPAIDRLVGDPGGRHTVDSLAEAAAMSRSAFMEHFVAAFGRPPMSFLHDLRMQRAARLLQTDPRLALDEVADRVGYASRSHFSQAFGKHYGVTPTTFRSAAPSAGSTSRRPDGPARQS